MRRKMLCDKIEECFSLLKVQTESYTSQNMFDINLECENLFANLLNLIFDWRLENSNVSARNTKGIDIADCEHKIIIQVSSTCTKDKIQKSLDKTDAGKYKGYHFKFLSIIRNADKQRKEAYQVPAGLVFAPEKDIIDIDFIIKKIKSLEIGQIEKVYEMMLDEMKPACCPDYISLSGKRKNETYTEAWFRQKVLANVKNIGERYSEKLDIDFGMYDLIDAMEQNEAFREKFRQEWNELSYSLTLEDQGKISSDDVGIAGLLDEMQVLVSEVADHVNHGGPIPSILQRCYKIHDLLKTDIQNIFLIKKLDDYITYLRSDSIKIAEKANVLIVGAAGVGKSHFLAHHALRRAEEGKISLLILGQLFYDRSHPYMQMKKQLGLPENTDMDEIFQCLNEWGRNKNENAIIFIDALNEGSGSELWQDYLNGIIEDFKRFEYISLVLSIRNTFCDEMQLEDLVEQNRFVKLDFSGFEDVDKAAAAFFAYYKVPYSINMRLRSQFQNPLFLKMYCKGYMKGADELYGIEVILKQYFYKIDRDIRKRYHIKLFPKNKNIVEFALNIIIDDRIQSGKHDILYDKVNLQIMQAFENYQLTFNMLDELIEEGMLECNTYSEQQYVYFSYELFDHYMIANRIVNEALKNVKDCKALVEDVFSPNSRYHKTISSNPGVLEAMAIILPDLDIAVGSDDCEVYRWPQEKGHSSITRAFYNSMLWRCADRIKPSAHSYVINRCFVYLDIRPYILDDFFDMVLQVSVVKNHIYSAEFLCRLLDGFSLEFFNRYWAIYVSGDFHKNKSFRTLLHWAWNCETNGLVECHQEMELLADTVVWFLASLNHKVRDMAIKALAHMYRGSHVILMRHLAEFSDVKDQYVLEGITAAAYGAILHYKEISCLGRIGEILYDNYARRPIDNIMIRDYVENIFSYLAFRQITSDRAVFDQVAIPTASCRRAARWEIDQLRSGAVVPAVARECDYYGISYEDYEEELHYEHDRIIRNLEIDVLGSEVERTEQEDFFVREMIGQIPEEDRIDVIRMITKEVFEMGYHAAFFINRDSWFEKANHDTMISKYVWIAMNKILERYLYEKGRLIEAFTHIEIPFEGIWQITFFRWMDPTMDFFSCFDTKVPRYDVCKTEDIMRDCQSFFRVQDAGDTWILANIITYFDAEGKKRDSFGSVVSEDKVDALLKNWNNSETITGIKAFEDLYIREIYWSDAYRYIQSQCSKENGLPEGAELVSENYIWDIGDGSMGEFISFSVISRYLLEELGLKSKAGGLELYKSGETVVRSLYEDTYKDILLIREKNLAAYLKEKHKCMVWPFYEKEAAVPKYIIYQGDDFVIC